MRFLLSILALGALCLMTNQIALISAAVTNVKSDLPEPNIEIVKEMPTLKPLSDINEDSPMPEFKSPFHPPPPPPSPLQPIHLLHASRSAKAAGQKNDQANAPFDLPDDDIPPPHLPPHINPNEIYKKQREEWKLFSKIQQAEFHKMVARAEKLRKGFSLTDIEREEKEQKKIDFEKIKTEIQELRKLHPHMPPPPEFDEFGDDGPFPFDSMPPPPPAGPHASKGNRSPMPPHPSQAGAGRPPRGPPVPPPPPPRQTQPPPSHPHSHDHAHAHAHDHDHDHPHSHAHPHAHAHPPHPPKDFQFKPPKGFRMPTLPPQEKRKQGKKNKKTNNPATVTNPYSSRARKAVTQPTPSSSASSTATPEGEKLTEAQVEQAAKENAERFAKDAAQRMQDHPDIQKLRAILQQVFLSNPDMADEMKGKIRDMISSEIKTALEKQTNKLKGAHADTETKSETTETQTPTPTTTKTEQSGRSSQKSQPGKPHDEL